MIEPFNLTHIILIILSICSFILIYFLMKRMKEENRLNFLIGLAFLGFALHFIKQLFYWDVTKLYQSSFINICAISTMIFPFVLLKIKKGKTSIIMDFLFFAGIMGGGAAIIYPTEAIDLPWYSFESLRFLFCHWSLCSLSILCGIFKFYTPKFKNWYKMLIGCYIYETIICANTALLCYTGAVTKEGYTATELFLSSKYMNNSFTFGPTSDMGFISKMFAFLTPNFMKYDIQGVTSCFPVVNLLIPSMVVLLPVYMIICLIFIKRQKEID